MRTSEEMRGTTGGSPDLIEAVIDHLLAARFENLSDKTVAMVKTLIIDTMGVAVAGSSATGLPELAGLVRDWGGKPEARTLVHGDRVPAFHAALLNGTMARAWDFDEVHEGGGGHLSASVIPTAFVLAQTSKKPISGRQLMLAIALGTDLIARLRMAQTSRSGWVAETFAPFGVVAAASALFMMERDRLLAAMGLAYAQCSSNTQGTVDGSLSVRLQQGFAAKAGVLAIQLAQIGFAGPVNVLEGKFGLYPLYTRNEYDRAAVTNELGIRFELDNTSLKPYPSCKLTHIPIALIANMTRQHAISAAEVKQITVHTNSDGFSKCASSPTKWRPRNVPDAQFSLPVMAAFALLKGTVTLSDLNPASWTDAKVQSLADRVKVLVDPELDRMPVLISPAIVEIETLEGKLFRSRGESVSGSPDQPLTTAELSQKYFGAVGASALPVSRERASKFMALVNALEDIEDIRGMTDLLVA